MKLSSTNQAVYNELKIHDFYLVRVQLPGEYSELLSLVMTIRPLRILVNNEKVFFIIIYLISYYLFYYTFLCRRN